MALVQIDFSPTGGIRKVTDIITGEWEGPVTRVDLTLNCFTNPEMPQKSELTFHLS